MTPFIFALYYTSICSILYFWPQIHPYPTDYFFLHNIFLVSLLWCDSIYFNGIKTLCAEKKHSVDPDQLASNEASWSGSTLFSKEGYIHVP